MGKARDGSECYTRTNKEGGKYITCEGSQKKREKRRKLKAGGEPPVMTKKPAGKAKKWYCKSCNKEYNRSSKSSHLKSKTHQSNSKMIG